MLLSQQDLAAALTHAVFFVQADDLLPKPDPRVWTLMARCLRDDPTTGLALDVTCEDAWATKDAHAFNGDVEFYVLAGQLTLGDVVLDKGDFAFIPAESPLQHVRATASTRFLLFSEAGDLTLNSTSAAQDTRHWTVTHGADQDWVGGTVLAEAGRKDIPLKIQHLKDDPDTGARTYLVAVNPGVVIPWEVHEVAEESYIVSGDYTLAECFPDGPRQATYTQGGYFYRPAGIAHNGPQSGTQDGAVMLIRTPAPLTVELLDKPPYG